MNNRVDTSKRSGGRRPPAGHSKSAGSRGNGIAVAEPVDSCSRKGNQGVASGGSTIPGISALKRRCGRTGQNASTNARVGNTKGNPNQSPEGRQRSSVHTLPKADEKKLKQHTRLTSEDNDSEAAGNGGVNSSGTDTGDNGASSSNDGARKRTYARGSSGASGSSASVYFTPPESSPEPVFGRRFEPPFAVTDSSDTSSEESDVTFSERIKRCCETFALLISLICGIVVDYVSYCLCCCCTRDDDDLEYEYLQSIGRRGGVFFEKPEQVPPYKSAKVSPFNGNVEGIERVQDNEQKSPVKEEEAGIASTSNHVVEMRKEWDKEKQKRKDTIIDAYCRAFKPYAEKGLYRGLGVNRREVGAIIENIKPMMYEYVYSESLIIISVRTDSGENVSDEDAQNVRNEVYSDLVYESLKKLNMSHGRIRETYELFHEERNNYSRLEDKDDDGCCLVGHMFGFTARSDLPYRASAYRGAIRKIKDEAGIK